MTQFPPENDITKVPAKPSLPPKIKSPIHSHLEYKLQRVFKMTGVKLTIGRFLLISIYLYQSTNRRFTNSHLFIYFDKGGFTIGLMVKLPLWKCMNKFENYI